MWFIMAVSRKEGVRILEGNPDCSRSFLGFIYPFQVKFLVNMSK